MNGYIDVLESALIFFPVVAFVFSIPFILHNYHKYGSIIFIKSLIIYSFILYLLCVYFLVILPLPDVDEVLLLNTPRVQLIPFKFFYDFFMESNIHGFSSLLKVIFKSCFYVPLYNIILTIPFGIYIKYYFNTDYKKTVIYTFLLSLFFELTQLTGLYFIYPRSYRLFDVDDLILNTIGGVIGYILSKYILKYIPSVKEVNASSMKKGMLVVSGFRKGTAIILDCFFITIIWFILSFVFKINYKYLFIFVLIFYLFLIPLLFKGRTFSELFLKLLVVTNSNNVNLLKTLIRRIIFILMYIAFPLLICLFYINNLINISTKVRIMIAILIAAILFFYYTISIIKYFFMKKLMLYEKISGTKYISTIRMVDNK